MSSLLLHLSLNRHLGRQQIVELCLRRVQKFDVGEEIDALFCFVFFFFFFFFVCLFIGGCASLTFALTVLFAMNFLAPAFDRSISAIRFKYE
jgi:hypothetical protein